MSQILTPVLIGSCTEKMRLVASSQSHDLVLGKYWCANRKALLDCDANKIASCHNSNKHKIHALQRMQIKEVNATALQKSTR